MLILFIVIILSFLLFIIHRVVYENGLYIDNKTSSKTLSKTITKINDFLDIIEAPIWLCSLLASIILFLFSLIIGISLLSVALTNANTRIEEEKLLDYQKLAYMSETIKWDDEVSLVEKEIIEDIINWNKDVNLNKEYRKSIWLKDYIPKYYEKLEEIELPKEYFAEY